MKIIIISLIVLVAALSLGFIKESDNIISLSESIKNQQELINRLTGESITNSDEIRNLKEEIYVHEIAKAIDIIDEKGYEIPHWDFETKYNNDIVLVNRYPDGRPVYICVDTDNKIIVSNCTYFENK